MASTSAASDQPEHLTESKTKQEQDKPLFTGSCICHAIKFTLFSLPIRSYICHCLDCRRTTGSSFAYNSCFPRSALEIRYRTSASSGNERDTDSATSETKPSNVLSIYGDQENGMQQFCKLCGANLFLYCKWSIEEMRDQVIIPTGVIDGSHEDEKLVPVAEGWCKRREPWMPEMKGTEKFDEW